MSDSIEMQNDNKPNIGWEATECVNDDKHIRNSARRTDGDQNLSGNTEHNPDESDKEDEEEAEDGNDESKVEDDEIGTTESATASSTPTSSEDSPATATATATSTTISAEDSYLPSWVLKMRHKIQESRLEHAKAESRIDSLHVSISNLDLNLTTLRSSSRSRNSIDSGSSSGVKCCTAHYSFKIHILPSDLVGEVLDYLTIDQIVKLECVSSSFKSCTADCPYWARNLSVYCPHKSVNSIARIDLRSEILRHVNQGNQCVEFIITMKNQRCIQRHDSIEPRRHSKSERGVTHPLPVFESNNNRNRSSSLTGNLSGDMIMSRAETLNADFRSIAHKTLEIMFNITRYASDPLHERLVSQGAVTVLISLLSNEAGVLQHFSCGVLANLLCWESRKNTLQKSLSLISAATDAQGIQGTFGTDAFLTKKGSKVTPLVEQLRACGGQGLLIALLTSPSASVNLSGTTGRVSGGLKELRMTASVQGMSTKQASRALITLFCPSQPIPAAVSVPYFENQIETSIHPSAKNDTNGEKGEAPGEKGENGQNGFPFPSPLKSAHSLGSLNNVNNVNKTDKNDSNINSRRKSLPPLTKQSNQSNQPQLQHQLQHQSQHMKITTMMSAYYLSEEFASPWTFKYYHKSGAFKDEFTTYLHFTPDGFIRGRGMDSIGLFYLTGRADIDISGWTWYFHKTYVSEDVADRPEGGESSDLSLFGLNAASLASSIASTIYPDSSTMGLIGAQLVTASSECDPNAIIPVGGNSPAGAVSYGSDPYVPSSSSAATSSSNSPPIPATAGGISNATAATAAATAATAATTAAGAAGAANNRSTTTADDPEEGSHWEWGVKGWMERAHVEYVYEGRARTHVSHTGYWAEGAKDIQLGGRSPSGDLLGSDTKSAGVHSGSRVGSLSGSNGVGLKGERLSGEGYMGAGSSGEGSSGEGPVWGMALWGVWETSSHGSHFELQKGGVFNATPLSYCR